MADAKTVLDFAKKHDAKILDLRFTDIPGLWHHVSYPIEQLTESSFEEGFGIDGSSIRAWAGIHESDMLLKPDASCYLLDPFTEVPTLVLVCDVVDPVTKQRYDRDPRYIARKAELYLASTRHRRHRVFWGRGRIFYLRQRALRSARAVRLLLHRRRRGTLEFGKGIEQSRLPAALSRRLLSRSPPPTIIRTCAQRWC